jgi:hypothetical protein
VTDTLRECIRCQTAYPENYFPKSRANIEFGRMLVCGACHEAVKWPREPVLRTKEPRPHDLARPIDHSHEYYAR